ncbi:hypothetical protein CYMTET_38651 [Cymbomonas tetramitiformis]|uniref:Uncharacterized protein n=1 Tax=Cymbomonas tetramitiformis TaxID=36881 RepID=A0AAE0F521_9CHLO|nr:hypothetical protein CYMTET_38651 [Cymbomonas tetramitiformis]
MRPQRHEKEMRVQVELRVMPLHLGADIVLGGDWLHSLQRVTLNYTGRGGGEQQQQQQQQGQQQEGPPSLMEDSAESDSDASRCSFATAASMEDLITASESSDSERGLTEAEDEAQELVCALHDLPGPAQDAGANGDRIPFVRAGRRSTCSPANVRIKLQGTTPRAWRAVGKTTRLRFGTLPALSMRRRLVDGGLQGGHAGKPDAC